MTSRPTPEFRRHHDVEDPRVDDRAFRQGWLVRTRLDQLLADGRISRAQWQAASEYRTAWGIARELGGVGPATVRVAAASDPDETMIARVQAATKLRLVEDAIGPFATRLLVASVVHDLAWAAIARFWRCNPETARDRTVVTIRGLTLAWTRLDARQGGGVDDHDRRRADAL